MHVEKPNPAARLIAWVLVHWCGTGTLARIERAIIEEVLARAHSARDARHSPRQLAWVPYWWTRLRIWRAKRRLYRTLQSWRFHG